MKRIITTIALACAAFLANAQMSNDKIVIGQKAPDFASPTPKGDKIRLSEINKNSVVLLDFWASWCRPCRAANPALVAMYNKFNGKKFKGASKGLVVLGVSLDQNKDKWVEAIAKDGLVWPQISDLNSWNSRSADIYGIQFIPQAFLIGPDGKIVGKYNTAEQAEADLEKLLAN